MPVPYPGTDTSSLGPCGGKERQTRSVHVPLMIGTEVSQNPRIPTSMGNPVSCVQAGGSDSMSFALFG